MRVTRRLSLETMLHCIHLHVRVYMYIYLLESYERLSRIHQDYVWQTRGRDLTYPGSPAENMHSSEIV